MPRKQSVTKEAIVYTAYEILRSKGVGELSVRIVSATLGVSTMPIYSQFKNMEALIATLFEKANATHIEFQKRPYTDNGLLNMSIGTVVFAQEEPQLFRFLHFDHPRKLTGKQKDHLFAGGVVDEVNQTLGVASPEDSPIVQQLPGSSSETIGKLAQKGWIFTIGLATMVNSGMLPRMNIEEIIELVQDAGTAFYQYHVSQ